MPQKSQRGNQWIVQSSSLPHPLSLSICIIYIPSSLWYKSCFSRQLNCWLLRWSWSIPCRRCSNYIFLLHLTLAINVLHKDNFKPRREKFQFWDLVRLILEILRYIYQYTIIFQASGPLWLFWCSTLRSWPPLVKLCDWSFTSSYQTFPWGLESKTFIPTLITKRIVQEMI